jgi:hypothetical protein
MNIAEEKLTLLHEIDELSEESLIELRKIIFKLKVKQKTKEKSSLENDVSDLGGFFKNNKIVLTDEELCKPIDFKGVWLGIEKWREQARFNEDDEVLTDEMVASWRDKSSGRDFSWNS